MVLGTATVVGIIFIFLIFVSFGINILLIGDLFSHWYGWALLLVLFMWLNKS